MNGILNNHSENKLHGVLCPKSPDAVETAGSLAMGEYHSLFANNSYDEFSCSNPFAVDYSLYSDGGDYVAYSGFLESFSNAISTLSDCGASFSAGGCDMGGGCSASFTSVC
jgi:hypothetical protein